MTAATLIRRIAARREIVFEALVTALHAFGESAFIVRLDDEVSMCALQADVDDAEVIAAIRGRQRCAERVVGVALAEALDTLVESHGDVRGRSG